MFMSEEVAMKACEFAANGGTSGGISFFGGEPLLRKELIYKMVEKCSDLGSFSFSMTTNGICIDEDFISFARKNRLRIALSHDGLAHDICRRFPDGRKSSDRLAKVLRLVNTMPDSVIMLTFAKETAHLLAVSVTWLFDNGARSVIATPDSRPNAGWDDGDMDILREQYELIAQDYSERLARGERVRFPVFDMIITDRTRGESRCNGCRIGYRQPIVFCDGSIYPCIQFTGIEKYKIGDVFSGFDEKKRLEIFEQSVQPVESCVGCAVADRCRHACPCLNFQQTGSMNAVSPFTCTNQRMLIECADKMAKKIYETAPSVFDRVFSDTSKNDGMTSF